jgi:hypothetical protein
VNFALSGFGGSFDIYWKYLNGNVDAFPLYKWDPVILYTKELFRYTYTASGTIPF